VISFIFAIFLYIANQWPLAVLWLLGAGLGLIEPTDYGYAVLLAFFAIVTRRFFNVAEVKI